MDLWEKVLHASLVGGAEAEGAAQEGRAASGGDEEDEAVARSYHDIMLSCKLRQAVRRAIDREGVSSRTTFALKPGDRLQRSSGRSTPTCVPPPWKSPRAQPSRSTSKYPKRYPSISRRMTSHGSHQSFPAQQVRWEQRRSSCKIGSFALDVHMRSYGSSSPGCLTGWPTPPPPWAAYRSLMACCLVALDKKAQGAPRGHRGDAPPGPG